MAIEVPKLFPLDAQAFGARLKEAIPKRPDGTVITVWDGFDDFVRSLRTLRDKAQAIAIQGQDTKNDLDDLRGFTTQEIKGLKTRVGSLEAQPKVPFPGSG